MRVPKPDSLRLSAEALLADVRQRLGDQSPGLAASLDPTHPAWIVLQQTAWMVQTLSEQLDDYPFAVVQQLAHLQGVQLRAARPSIGVVALTPRENGTLDFTDDPGRWRFFAPRTETRGLLEFAAVERQVPVTAAAWTSACRVDGGVLRVLDVGNTPTVRFHEGRPSRVFGSESFTWTVLASAVERVEELLVAATERLRTERRIGWLSTEIQTRGDHVVLTARIDVNRALSDAPAITAGGDLLALWGTPDDSNYTPPVRLANDARLPRDLRGSRPFSSDQPGMLLLPDLPAGLPTADLLVRDAKPAPTELMDALWRTLVNLESRLGALRPVGVRGADGVDGEPAWVDTALRGGAWPTLVDRDHLTLASLQLVPSAEPRTVRVGWVGASGRTRAFALFPEGADSAPLASAEAWRERFPDGSGREAWVQVVGFEVPANAIGLVLTCDGFPDAVFLNPALVVNAPIVRDGRRVAVTRAIPEPVHLLYPDLVTPDVVDSLSRSGLHASTSQRLSQLPLARFESEDEALIDFEGVSVDAASGKVWLNAPDPQGRLHPMRRGTLVHTEWYRRTDASTANVPADSITLVEQPPSASPRLLDVEHPLATHHGTDRESEQAAIQRAFGPPMPVPVTPGDWERSITGALGPRAADWSLRVFGYSERTLISGSIWPPESVAHEPSSEALSIALETAGTDTLLVVLGPPERRLADEELTWARTVIEGLVHRTRERVPTISHALVAPLWTLTLEGSETRTPTHRTLDVTGTLVDVLGRSASVPQTAQLLNAVIGSCRA